MTMPGSGFAQTFIGMDVVIVMILIRKARRLARKWGGQCIIFIDEIDAVGRRRQALGGGVGAASSRRRRARSRSTTAFYGPWGALNAVRATSSSRRARGASGSSPSAPSRRSRCPPAIACASASQNFMFPAAWAAGRAGAQPAARADGRRRRAAVLAQVLRRRSSTRSSTRPTSSRSGSASVPLRLRAAEAARGADLLHRRDQRPARRARPGAHPPGPHGPPHLVPHADQGRPQGHLRPLPRQGRPRPRPRPRRAPRRARAHHQRLLAGDDRAGLLDGADLRALRRPRRTFDWQRHRRGDDDDRVGHRGRRRVRRPRRRARSRSTRPATRSPATSTCRTCSRRACRSACAAARSATTRRSRRRSASRRWRHEEVGKLVWTLGAMAAEHVFYGENSTGVGGDVRVGDARAPRAWSASAAWAPSRSTSTAASPSDEERREAEERLHGALRAHRHADHEPRRTAAR